MICGAPSAPSPCSSVRNPDYSNMLGWDLKQVASPNAIANGATSAQLALSTNGDTYYPDCCHHSARRVRPAVRAAGESGRGPAGEQPGEDRRHTPLHPHVHQHRPGRGQKCRPPRPDPDQHHLRPRVHPHRHGRQRRPPRPMRPATTRPSSTAAPAPKWWCASAPERTRPAAGRWKRPPRQACKPEFLDERLLRRHGRPSGGRHDGHQPGLSRLHRRHAR